jgi:signal peptidase I
VLRSPGAAWALVTALLIAAAGAVVGGLLLGWSVMVVQSPSMGTAAPIGTLVLVQRTDTTTLHRGDVISYRPPEGGTTYTHRIVRVVPGGFRTQGDINGAADPWLVRPTMVVGRAVALLPGAGWVVRLVPWLAIGVVVVWFASWPIRSVRLRSGSRLIGACAVVTGTLLVLRPVAGYSMLTTAPSPRGMLATVVSTGMLPVRIDASGGRSVRLAPGEVARLLMPADHAGHVQLSSTLSLDLAGWCGFGLLCALPLLGVLVFGLPSDDHSRPA